MVMNKRMIYITFASISIHFKTDSTLAQVRPFKVFADLFISTYGFIVTLIDIDRTIRPCPAWFTDTASLGVTTIHTLSTFTYLAAIFTEIWFFTFCVKKNKNKSNHFEESVHSIFISWKCNVYHMSVVHIIFVDHVLTWF